jgi:electron transfer flavoprotein beta subunit
LDRESVDAVLNDLDEYAIEEALRIVEPLNEGKETPEHTITLISMGPDRATEAIRKGLSMGADNGLLVTDPALAGSDAIATSKVLAEVIRAGGFDLVSCDVGGEISVGTNDFCWISKSRCRKFFGRNCAHDGKWR